MNEQLIANMRGENRVKWYQLVSFFLKILEDFFKNRIKVFSASLH